MKRGKNKPICSCVVKVIIYIEQRYKRFNHHVWRGWVILASGSWSLAQIYCKKHSSFIHTRGLLLLIHNPKFGHLSRAHTNWRWHTWKEIHFPYICESTLTIQQARGTLPELKAKWNFNMLYYHKSLSSSRERRDHKLSLPQPTFTSSGKDTTNSNVRSHTDSRREEFHKLGNSKSTS